MNLHFEKAAEKYASSYCLTLEAVARERKYLASTKGFSRDSVIAFVRNTEQHNLAQFFALESENVVGWCDILPKKFEGMTHVGVLGMGVLASYRGKGIGKRLLRLTLEHAKQINKLEKVELEVFKTNTAAMAMYVKEGFVIEGERIDSRKLDGTYDNIILMGKKI